MDLTGFLNELITAPGVSGGETCVSGIVGRAFWEPTNYGGGGPMGSVFLAIG